MAEKAFLSSIQAKRSNFVRVKKRAKTGSSSEMCKECFKHTERTVFKFAMPREVVAEKKMSGWKCSHHHLHF